LTRLPSERPCTDLASNRLSDPGESPGIIPYGWLLLPSHPRHSSSPPSTPRVPSSRRAVLHPHLREAALAELIENLLLFIPSAPSARARRRTSRADARKWGAIGFGLSFSVEFLQQWIPGRDPTPATSNHQHHQHRNRVALVCSRRVAVVPPRRAPGKHRDRRVWQSSSGSAPAPSCARLFGPLPIRGLDTDTGGAL